MRFRGVRLGGAAGTVLDGLRAAGIEAAAGDSGWILADSAIALYTTSSEADAPVEAVTVFGPGHEMRGEIVFFPSGEDAAPPANTHVVSPGSGIGSALLGQPRDDVRRRLNEGLCW